MVGTFKVNGQEFYLNDKPFKIYSGAMNYFRTLPEYWEERLTKLKPAGFNTVATYVCWNLHEPKKGVFDFNGMLDIVRFIETAQKLGLYAIVRPGPYICAEWDFGGFSAGANHEKGYQPTVTSYDYCAPLTEWGDYTEAYHKVRKLLCEHQNIPLTELPPSPKMQEVGNVKLTQSADLFDNLEKIAERHTSPLPRSMESYGQNFGLIYYVTKLKGKYDRALSK